MREFNFFQFLKFKLTYFFKDDWVRIWILSFVYCDLARLISIINMIHYTSTKSWRGYTLTAICLCVCVCVSVCMSLCEQNSNRTNRLIWTRFSLNSCLLHWLGPYWNWWPCVKGQGHCDCKCTSKWWKNIASLWVWN